MPNFLVGHSKKLLSKTVPAAAVAILLMAFSAIPKQALAYYFRGYYCPAMLVSPMQDKQVYTPVGLGVVTSRAGFRVHPVTGRGDFHSGVDLGAKLNDKVYNLLDGVVTRVGWRGALGVAIEVYHPYPNIRTICGHLNAYSVLPGQWVQRGRVIGYAGSTGRSTGVHVHYTVIRADTNEYVEPMQYLTKVPKYIQALKTARARATIAVTMRNFKKNPLKAEAINSQEEDLPEQGKKSEAPDEPAS